MTLRLCGPSSFALHQSPTMSIGRTETAQLFDLAQATAIDMPLALYLSGRWQGRKMPHTTMKLRFAVIFFPLAVVLGNAGASIRESTGIEHVGMMRAKPELLVHHGVSAAGENSGISRGQGKPDGIFRAGLRWRAGESMARLARTDDVVNEIGPR
ncbi:hypothetical protein [Polaromonas sp.]|uniref:hypothetical protein n=1 Tax=Polaromonas sp. TaxID=1869339 RepID=UPI003BACAA95